MREKSIDLFLEELSSGAPTPGGGGASALMGAVASSLCSMVANLTSGKKKYAEYQSDIEGILKDTAGLTDKLLTLIEKDAEVFEPLAKAYSIPKDSEGRDDILEAALKEASMVPYEIVSTLYEVALLIEELTVKGSRLAISDVGVAASACAAAAKGAAMNVYINTKLMKDRDFAREMNEQTDGCINKIALICEKAYEDVLGGLKT